MQSTKNVSQETNSHLSTGLRIQEIRKREGLSLEKFGEKIGFGKSYISKVERGVANNFSEDFILSICTQFNINRTWLISGHGNVSHETNALNKIHSSIEEQWASESSEQLKTLLQQRVDNDDWGAVLIVAKKLLDRQLDELNKEIKSWK